MATLYYSLCALQVLRAYATACEEGAEFCEYMQPDHQQESE